MTTVSDSATTPVVPPIPRAIRRQVSFDTDHLTPPPTFHATVHAEHACRYCHEHHCAVEWHREAHTRTAARWSTKEFMACPACGESVGEWSECIVLVRVEAAAGAR